MSGAVKPGPRPAASYRVNGRSPKTLPVIGAAKQRKTGVSWPNPQNPNKGRRENFRRTMQAAWARETARVKVLDAEAVT